ncbi:MAG: hypothetical protein QXN55_07835, partial [Candidatus Nitrosotenuis sp.]
MSLLNVYLIENLSEIKCAYKLFKVRGLDPESEDYDKNAQILSDKLSRITKSPCEIIKKENELYLAQPVGCQDPPTKFSGVRVDVLIEPTNIVNELNYGELAVEDNQLALRFLKFYLDGPLYDNHYLWRPGAGKPFYQKLPDEAFSLMSQTAEAYKGFKLRPIILSDNRIGLCVDLTMTYAAKHTLPTKISSNDIRKYKGKHCIYEYGHKWYEIRIEGLSNLNVSEVEYPTGGSLYDHLQTITNSHKPKTLQMLPKDCSVLTYKTSTGEIRNVPSGLCRLVYMTNHPSVREYHTRSIMAPFIKKKEIDFVVRKYLKSLSFQQTPLKISERMLELKTERFLPPDLKFGNGKILSVKGTINSIRTLLEEFGFEKNKLLFSNDAGFFTRKPLDKQYIVLPKSIMAKFGEVYISDIKEQFKKMYSLNDSFLYAPSVVTYDDTVHRSVYPFGREIVETVLKNSPDPGYALVIIPRLRDGYSNKEDELANYVMRELRKHHIYASAAHAETPLRNYIPTITSDGQTIWQKTSDIKQQKRFRSYLSNVILNKILLLNSCWPFVLNQPLHADLTIGIDVKSHTAGFTLIFKDGKTLSFHASSSDQKEQLSRNHLN